MSLSPQPVINEDPPVVRLIHGFRVYRWMISFVKPYRNPLLLLIVSGLVIVGVELLIPKLIQIFVDRVLPDRDYALFGWLLIGLCVSLVIMFAFMALRNRLERVLREKASFDLTKHIFQQLRWLGFSYFEQSTVNDSLFLFNTDVSKVQEIYRRYLPEIVWKAIFVALSILLMAGIDYRLTLIMLVSFCFYYVLGPYLEKETMKLIDEGDALYMQTERRIYELLSGLGEVRAYGAERWAFDNYAMLWKQIGRNAVQFWIVWSSRDAFRRLMYYIGAVAVFVYAAYRIRDGSLSVGAFVAFILYYFNGLLMMTNIVTDITEQRALMVHARRLYAFAHLEPEVQEPEHPVTLPMIHGELRLQEISFHYPNKKYVLYKFHLHVRPGEKVALVGASGHGKSTVLKLIGRFYDPFFGEVSLDGVPLPQLSLSQLRGALGYVFQETYLFGSSVRDNIRFGRPAATDEEIVEAARAAYAHDFILKLPQQYDTLVGERGIKLSGSQKQRVAIARMLLKQPAIVVLDEATSALDQTSEREVRLALDRLLEGRTTIAVAHRLSTVMDYDRIVVVDDGEVAEQGTYRELVRKQGLFYQLLEGEQQGERAGSAEVVEMEEMEKEQKPSKTGKEGSANES
ncbi:ABC transporter ATP-binding protein [Paenibacillus koleovorans]|uniref:ABC transporter ATP-binding protein n=1 Tax=Paenibacillus koleovorans TaxID=121608 RepID=UPI000FDAE46B|nr:ABC transporter ATP-binding protein [Paenibacillus koleovorans]